MVTVDPTFSDKLMEVNVTGTPITEVDRFTPVDERTVVGAYSLSKAIATQIQNYQVHITE